MPYVCLLNLFISVQSRRKNTQEHEMSIINFLHVDLNASSPLFDVSIAAQFEHGEGCEDGENAANNCQLSIVETRCRTFYDLN